MIGSLAVGPWLESWPSGPEPQPQLRPQPRRRGWWRWPVLIGATAALVLVAMGVVVWSLGCKGKTDAGTSADVVEGPLKVKLRVLHYERQQGRDVPHGPSRPRHSRSW
jgi:hypothetical protein